MLFRLYLRKLAVFLTLKKKNKRAKGSGIFTVNGRELAKIPGGYDLLQTNSGLGHNNFVDN